MKTLQLVIFVLAASFAVAATLEGEVVKVSDGDTVHVLAGKQKAKVGLDRINAPESLQEYGKEATRHLADLIFGKTVKVLYDKKDRYGRILGIIFMDGLEINLEMVASGNAWHYRQFDKTIAYCDAERMAREKELGLWANPSPICPQEWRRRNKKRSFGDRPHNSSHSSL